MSAPKKIYLQLGEDIIKSSALNLWHTGNVSWCAARLDDSDIEYVLAEEHEKVVENRASLVEHHKEHHEELESVVRHSERLREIYLATKKWMSDERFPMLTADYVELAKLLKDAE